MAATGYTPIQLYYTTTASNVPLAGNLVTGELAINTTDGKLYFKNTAGAVTLLATSTEASGTFDYITAVGSITGARSAGAFSYGTLGYTDTNIFASFTSSVNSYNQIVLQNTNAGAVASTDYVVSNNLGTASTYYGDFGMNSSGFTGTGSLSLANAVYVSSTTADLVIGTNTANAIRFVTNNSATDAASISSAGVFTIGTLNLTNALSTAYGGTGLTSYTAGDLPYYVSGTTLSKLAIGGTGQILTSTGTGLQWTTLSSVGVTSISFGSTGLTPATATSGAVTVAGTLALANGGTGATTVAAAQTNLQVDPAGTAVAMAIALG